MPYSFSTNLVEIADDSLDSWEVIKMPSFDYSTFPDADNFDLTFSMGMYKITEDYLLEIPGNDADFIDFFYSYYDGWHLGIYVSAAQYAWDWRGSESFGVCVDNFCTGIWAEYQYTEGSGATYSFNPIYFYSDSPSTESPYVSYKQNESYQVEFSSFTPSTVDGQEFGYRMPGSSFFWMALPIDGTLFSGGDRVDIVSFTSASSDGQNRKTSNVKLPNGALASAAASAALVALSCAATF